MGKMNGADADLSVDLNVDPTQSYIGFSTSRGNPVSALIRWIMGSDVSHVWLVTSFYGVPCVVEANEHGFFPSSSLKNFATKNKVIAIYPIPSDIRPGLAWAAIHFGERYDFGGLFGAAIVILGRFFHRRWRNPLGSRKALFCSEAATEVLQRSLPPMAEGLAPDQVIPTDLRQIFAKNLKNSLSKESSASISSCKEDRA